MSIRVLLVEDDEALRKNIEKVLTSKGYQVYPAENVEDGLAELRSRLPDVALVDIVMPGGDGFCVMEQATNERLPTRFIVMSGYGDVKKAVRACKLGACQFLEKPFGVEEIESAIKSAVGDVGASGLKCVAENGSVRIEGDGWKFFGASEAMRDVFSQIMLAGRTGRAPVIIQGESGTGKELVARAIYENSPRSEGGFVDINITSLSDTLLESELFGHEKGALTGADEKRRGLFEVAHKGVIFLDEIGDMPLKLQAKLLRVLEEKSLKRVGGTENIKVDFRVIASTNKNLREMVEKGEFRQDLYYRLNVFEIFLPPLRERREDIIPLAMEMMRDFSELYERKINGFDDAASEALENHSWPGNARELRNVVERAVIICAGDTISHGDLDLAWAPPSSDDNTAFDQVNGQTLEDMEKGLIKKVLEETNWQRTRAAEILGINRTTLWHKIKRYGLMEDSVEEQRED